MDVVRLVDDEIKPLVAALRKAGLDTDWSCSGVDDSHLVIRPTIQIRTAPFISWEFIQRQKHRIEKVMAAFKIGHYWLSLVFAHGAVDTHGREATWLLEIQGRFDYLALPVAYSIRHLSKGDAVEDVALSPFPSLGIPVGRDPLGTGTGKEEEPSFIAEIH